MQINREQVIKVMNKMVNKYLPSKWDLHNQVREEHLQTMSYEDYELQANRERLAVMTNKYNDLKAKNGDLQDEIKRLGNTIETLMSVKSEFQPPVDLEMKKLLMPIVKYLRSIYWNRNACPTVEGWEELTALLNRCL